MFILQLNYLLSYRLVNFLLSGILFCKSFVKNIKQKCKSRFLGIINF